MINGKFRNTEIGKLPNEWSVNKLNELVTIKGRIGWKGLKKSEFGNNGVIIINGPDIGEGKVDWNNCARVPQWRYYESKEISVNVDDILLTKDGTIGKVARIKFLPEPATLASGIFLIRKKVNSTVIDHNFLYYYFKSPYFENLVESRIEGSVIPHLYQRDIEQLMVPLPPLCEQQSIAKILSDLDEKIELNNQMNKTLEEIAQAIFKRWFIDFEFPNENGDPYKSSGGEMVESELGMIPKGWEIVSLSNIADFLNGLPLQNYRPREDEECLPVIKIRELRNGFTDSTERCTSNIPKSYIAENGDVIFSWSGSLEVVIWSYGKGAINQHLFKVSSEKYPKWFYYFWLLRFLSEFRKIAEDKATTMGHIQRHHLNESLLPVPPQELMDKFGKPIESEFEEAITLRIQSMTLSNLRDILLPKLMTGRIRVPLED
jgi:type I restriction enzyme S subunit